MRQEVLSEPEDTEQLSSGTGAGVTKTVRVRSASKLPSLKQEASVPAGGAFLRHQRAGINLPDLRDDHTLYSHSPRAVLKFVT